MSEAEDVLLAAAERIHVGVRERWERRTAPQDASASHRARAERRIATWLASYCGVSPPVVAWDAPLPPSWLARALGRLAPWQERPLALAWNDGGRLFLPRAQLEAGDPALAEPLLLAALALGRRIARASRPGETPRTESARAPCIERDLCFALEAARGDARLATRLPGLAPALDRARARARDARPAQARLTPAERGVEGVVRALLEGPARDAQQRSDALLEIGEDPVDAARRLAGALGGQPGAYRGFAPVEHWGASARPTGASGALRAAPAAPGEACSRRPPSRSLGRAVLRRAAEEGEEPGRSGPFVVPGGDPQLAVQDAAGVARPQDGGEEDLDALADELERAGELPTLQGAGAVREILESEAGGARKGSTPAALEADAVRTLSYPEWDRRRSAYRDPGIRLREARVLEADAAWASRLRQQQGPLLARLRRHFEALRPQRERIGRQLEGDDVDVDGIVAEHAERLAGLAPEGRIYAQDRPRRRDVAVALLLDASGSTDAWVSGSDRVIDIAKQAAFCLAEALRAIGDRTAIYAFSGRGAGDVRVQVAKHFAEPWSEAVSGRIGAIQPDHSTRLGGPLRHVTAQLARQPARVRLLLLLSDGKPDDEDIYEGEYGLEDVRQAVFEARSAGVHPFCVTIDRSARGYLPHLFGPHGYTVLWDVQQLPARLPAIYRKLALG